MLQKRPTLYINDYIRNLLTFNSKIVVYQLYVSSLAGNNMNNFIWFSVV